MYFILLLCSISLFFSVSTFLLHYYIRLFKDKKRSQFQRKELLQITAVLSYYLCNLDSSSATSKSSFAKTCTGFVLALLLSSLLVLIGMFFTLYVGPLAPFAVPSLSNYFFQSFLFPVGLYFFWPQLLIILENSSSYSRASKHIDTAVFGEEDKEIMEALEMDDVDNLDGREEEMKTAEAISNSKFERTETSFFFQVFNKFIKEIDELRVSFFFFLTNLLASFTLSSFILYRAQSPFFLLLNVSICLFFSFFVLKEIETREK